MKPLLSKFEQESDEGSSEVRPAEESTTLDRIYKSTLLQPDNFAHGGTKVTKVRAETIDDD